MNRYVTLGLFCLTTLSLCARAADEKTGILSGKAVFKGQAPERQKLDASADPACCKDHPNPMSEDVVVDKENRLKNVVVYIKEGLPDGKTYAAPTTPVVMDQVGCVFVPHVVALRVGQELKVTNSDNTQHNVHGYPRKSSEFNDLQHKKGTATNYTFKEPETPGFLIKCDVHPWMKSYVWVLPHPFFAVTGDDGSFKLPPLPPGEYTLEAWQEKCGKQQQKIKIEEGKTTEVELTFELKKRR